MTIEDKAREFTEYFKQGTRDNGEGYVYLTRHAPQWAEDAVYDCHKLFDLLPNDWLYQAILDVATGIAEDGDEHDVDELVDVYNNDLLTWYASNLTWLGVTGEARADGMIGDTDVISQISVTQWYVYYSIQSKLFYTFEELTDGE